MKVKNIIFFVSVNYVTSFASLAIEWQLGKHLATSIHVFTSLISFPMQRGQLDKKFFTIYCVFMHTLSYRFLKIYVCSSPSDMQDFSLRDLHTIYLPHYVSIMFQNLLI